MIHYNEKTGQFDLLSEHDQLSLGILASGHVAFYYWGKQLGLSDLSYVVTEIQRASYLADTDGIKDFKLEQLPLVYPAYGNPDMRTPAFQLQFENGSRLSDFRYQDHVIGKKQPIAGLPTTLHENAESLELILFDKTAAVELRLVISVFPEYDVFTQHVCFINKSQQPVKIDRCMSLSLDFLTDDFEALTLGGAWGRETQLDRRTLHRGFQGVDSKRGASGHGQNPFIALLEKGTTEIHGRVYSTNLVYSGNFAAAAEVDMHQNTRLQIGINPFDFNWCLQPTECFATPEAIMVFSDSGLNTMSQGYHRFYTDCLIPPRFAKKERPILFNNWEATYFDFDRQLLLELAEAGQELGMELFVLDDGWFGQREAADSSLGDWYPNEAKLGGSLTELIEKIEQMGLAFGLWVEPEMVSPNSQLYQSHPEWIIQTPDRKPQQVRQQYVLDLSRREVQEYVIDSLSALLSNNKITYLKWDMNRNITDLGSRQLANDRQCELSHRYVLGLYRVLNVITTKFPDLLLESCAGGGGRFDPGMLAFSPQIWTSDDTDAVERLKIQRGTSLIYPPASMSCHVSAVPNHQVGRSTSLNTRSIVAQQGNFGYELNLLALTEAEKETIQQQIAAYKQRRRTMQFGVLDWLPVYDEENEFAWMQQDDEQLIVNHVLLLVKGNTVPKRLKLVNLNENSRYQLAGTKRIYTGSELLSVGLSLPKPTHDYYGKQWLLNKLDQGI